MPPEKLMGIVGETFVGMGDPDQLQHVDGSFARLLLAQSKMATQRFHYLIADRQHRVQRRHGILKDEPYLATSHVLDGRLIEVQQISSIKHGTARDNLGRRHRQQFQQRHHGDALARPTFADHGQSLAGIEREAHTVDRMNHTVVGPEAVFECSAHQAAHWPFPRRHRAAVLWSPSRHIGPCRMAGMEYVLAVA